MGVRQHPIIWLAALLAGASFFGAALAGLHGPAIIAWKGAGVALFALWAARQAASRDGWWIAAVMALGALGDILLETHGLRIGGTAFAIGHLLAIALYLRHRRPALTPSQRALGLIVVPFGALTTFALAQGSPGLWPHVVYGTIVSVMAATAWTSRFPRYQTGIGAMMFLASDLLIFAKAGGAVPAPVTQWLIWPLYFGGQALIVHGVVSTLRGGAQPHAAPVT
ncbi:MAG: hypothetical protein RLZZ58_822 [Pseudomonadota bacterium]